MRLRMTARSTYHAECLCGKAIVSFERETTCEACGRLLVFEWGADPVVIGGLKAPAERPTEEAPPPKPKAMGASA